MPKHKLKKDGKRSYHPSECCKAHCTFCGLHFASQNAFDEHLAGPNNNFDHYDPSTCERLRVRTRDGLCTLSWNKNPKTGRVVKAKIWEHGPDTDRARKNLG